MKNPIISWLDAASMKEFGAAGAPAKMQFSSKPGVFEPVLADTDSVEMAFYIANNYTNGTPVADDSFDMKNCSLTVKSAAGDFESPIVKEKWVSVRCDSLGEVAFTAIGAHLNGATFEEDSHPISAGDAAAPRTIKGIANDGTVDGTGRYNLAKITSKIHPPLLTLAPANKNSAKFRLVYTFGEGV